MNTFFIALIGAASTFFGLMWYSSFRQRQNMSDIEKVNLRISAERAKEERQTALQRMQLRVRQTGYDGPLQAVAAVYVLVSLAVTVVADGLTSAFLPFSVLLGFGVTILLGYAYSISLASKRRERFDVQLLEYIGLVRGQLQSGAGVKAAMDRSLGGAGDPLQHEMRQVLDKALATKDLVEQLNTLAEKYPSRAFELFVSALEINEVKGGELAPSLDQAQKTLQATFELEAEAKAEISQVKGEFYGSLALLGFIVFFILGSGGTLQNALKTPAGAIACGVAGLNVLIGILRGRRVIARAGKSE